MKRITNILSYLCLLLLLPVVACSDLEEIVVNMQGEEEVELTIKTNVPSLGGSTRSVVDAENITSITALAFDSDHELIKVAIEDVTISPSATPSTSGTYTVKVPVRTRRIHFIAKNGDAEFTEITNDDYGKSDEYLLKDRLTSELHYWGKLDFDDAEDLTTNVDGDDNVTLYRNMAKLELVLPDGVSGYIAGFLNYNTDGTIAAYSGDDFNYHTEKTSTHYLPATHTDSDEDDKYKNAQTKPIVQYLFEEENANGDYVYVICNIADKYYKIAFAYADANDETVYFPIVRNHSYTINIKEGYSTAYGKDSFEKAIDADPINATAQEEVEFIFDSETIIMFIEDRTCEISVTIPEGITQLKVLPVNILTIQSISPELTLGANDLYTVVPERTYTFTMKLDESHTETGKAPVRFIGEGVGKIAHKDVEVKLRRKATITINPSERTMNNTQGSNCYFDVTIPDNINNLVIEAADAFTITEVVHTSSSTPVTPIDDGSYTVTNATYRVTLSLKEEAIGQTGEYSIHFAGTSEYWGAEGTATITLQDYVLPDSAVYEIWVNNGTWVASDEYSVEFFGYEGPFVTGGQELGNNFYDALTVNDVTYSADNHKQQAMLMGSDDSFTFTIPEGDNRWLTMLVANDGDDSDTPSINLQKDGAAYTKDTAEDLANGTYNFAAEGEITSAGRLIRYELPAGTYTLKGSDAADYLLYYMRVSTTKPTMTDIVTDATASNYTLAWSGGEYGQYIKVENSQTADYVVDEDATTFTPTLNYSGLNLTNVTLVVNTDTYLFTDRGENISGTDVTYTQENGTYQERSIPVKLADNLTAGVYTLSGKAEVSEAYKYAAFYDYAQLNAVGFTVKNTIKVGLYYNWYDGAVWNYTDGYNDNGDRMNFFLGFKTPYYTLPVSVDTNSQTVTPINFTLSDDWVRTNSGLGIDDSNAPAYRLVTQYTNSENTISRTHPQTKNYVYRIQWRDVAAESIKVSTTDTDVYFSGKGIDGNNVIGKEITIATPITNDNLEINLDFSAVVDNNSEVTEAENRSNNVYNDLQLGTSRFYLTATISYQDSKDYNGQSIQLIGRYPSVNGGANGLAIDWDGSSQDGSTIVCSTNGEYTTLKFNVVEGTTEYRIAWEFVPGQYYQGGDINFDYVISNADGNSYIITGDTQATIGFTNEPTSNGQIQVAANGSAASNSITMPLEYGANSTEEFTVDVTVPAGVTQINIEAEDFDIAWGDMDNSNTNISSHTFSSSSDSQTTRFKFTLKDSSNTENSSTITFSDNSGSAASATITVDLSPRTSEPSGGTTIWNGMMDLSWDYALNYLSVKDQIPTGSVVTLNFTTTTGGAFKLHDKDGGVDAIVLPNISYGDNPGVISVNSGQISYSFTVTNDIIVNNQNISEYIDGLKINGDNVRMTSIVVKYPVIYCNFDNDIEGFYVSGKGSVERVDNALALISDYNETDEPWAAQAMKTTDKIEYGATYTLTFKAKIANGTTGEMAVAIQRFENGECVATDHYRIFTINDINNAEKDNQDWAEFTYDITIHDNNQETPNENNPTHFMFNFGDINGTVYIDDLKLVKKNQ